MDITIHLTADEEARLRTIAAKSGVSDAECARQAVVRQLVEEDPTDQTLDLLAVWEAEDATDDPEEIQQAEAELAELKAGLNAPRADAGARLLFP